MKKQMILGALIGFVLGTASGWSQDCSWPTILWRATVCACAAGMLLRLWARVWAASLQKVATDRLAARAAAEPQAFVFPRKQ